MFPVIQVIDNIMLHRPCFLADSVFILDDGLDVLTTKGAAPAGPAVSIKDRFSQVDIIPVFSKFRHAFVGVATWRG